MLSRVSASAAAETLSGFMLTALTAACASYAICFLTVVVAVTRRGFFAALTGCLLGAILLEVPSTLCLPSSLPLVPSLVSAFLWPSVETWLDLMPASLMAVS